MGLVVVDALSVLRHRGRAFLGVVLLLGLTGGLGLLALAGARRTQSAYPRFLRSVDASTLGVSTQRGYDAAADRTIAAAPQVVRSSTYVAFQSYVSVDGRPDFAQISEVDGTFDGRFFHQDRFTALEGRLPDTGAADEVVVNEYAAHQFGYHVGQRLELGTFALDQIERPDFFTRPPPPRLQIQVTITGIGLFPEEVVQDDEDRTARMLVTPAFSQRARPLATYGIQGLVLAHGDADVAAVEARVNRLFPPGQIEFRVTSVDVFHELQATRPLSIALALFGAIILFAGLVLVVQALSRILRADRERRAVVRALGATPTQLELEWLLAAGSSAVAGATVAVVAAVAASPLMPIGPVRQVEVAPGVSVDATVLAVGFALLVTVIVAASALLAWRDLPHRLVRQTRPPSRPSWLLTGASASGLPPTALTGLRFAVEREGRGDTAGTRSVMAGAALAVAALVASVTFGASFRTLVGRPRLYGWNWDVAVSAGDGFGNIDPGRAAAILSRDPHVASWSGAYFGADSLDGEAVPLIGMDPGSRETPPMLRGRMIEHEDEIVLGPATAARLGRSIGDTVELAGGGHPHRAKVVGIATFPTMGELHVAHTSLGVGALVAHREVPGYDRDITGAPAGDLGPHVLFVRFRPGTAVAAERRNLERTTAPLAGFAGLDVLAVQRPAEIVNSSSVASSPELLAGAVALAAALSLGLAIASSVRRRRRDLAVLKTLGFTRRQVTLTVTWLASTTIAVGLAVGVPIGLLVGRDLWIAFARELDVVAHPVVPTTALVVIVVGALAIANLVAAVPAFVGRRVEPSRILRSS